MLPAFDDIGHLPPGIHRCTIDQLVARFGEGSDERTTETSELVLFIEAAKRARVRHILVNGSYVTGKTAPNDLDIVILPDAAAPNPFELRNDELAWPFLQIIVAADDDDFEAWGTRHFATDRQRRPKGVVEVVL